MKKSPEQRIGGPNSIESLQKGGFCPPGDWRHIKVVEVGVGEDATVLMRVRPASLTTPEGQFTLLQPFKKDRKPYADRNIKMVRPTAHTDISNMTTVFLGKSVVKAAQDYVGQMAEEREAVIGAMVEMQNDDISALLKDFEPVPTSTDEDLAFAERHGAVGGAIFEQAKQVVKETEEKMREEFVRDMNA